MYPQVFALQLTNNGQSTNIWRDEWTNESILTDHLRMQNRWLLHMRVLCSLSISEFLRKAYIFGTFIFRILWTGIFQVTVNRFPELKSVICCVTLQRRSLQGDPFSCEFALLMEVQNDPATKQVKHRLQHGPNHSWSYTLLALFIPAIGIWQVNVKRVLTRTL